jgi:hypothetical protein
VEEVGPKEMNPERDKKNEGEEEMTTDNGEGEIEEMSTGSREREEEMSVDSGVMEEGMIVESGEKEEGESKETIARITMAVKDVQRNKVVDRNAEDLEEGELTDQEDEDLDKEVRMEREAGLDRTQMTEVNSTTMDSKKMRVFPMEREYLRKLIANQKSKIKDAVVGCLEVETDQGKSMKKRESPEYNKNMEKETTEENRTQTAEEERSQVTMEESPPRTEKERSEREIKKKNLQSAEEIDITEQKGEKEKPKKQEQDNTEECSPVQKSAQFDMSVDNSYENIKNTTDYLSNSSLSDSSLIRNSTPNDEQVGQKRKNKDPDSGLSFKRMRAIETLANLIVTPLGQIVKDFLTRTFGQEDSRAFISNEALTQNIGGALMNGCAGYLEYQVKNDKCLNILHVLRDIDFAR